VLHHRADDDYRDGQQKGNPEPLFEIIDHHGVVIVAVSGMAAMLRGPGLIMRMPGFTC
jgi:hypothetical protein